MNLVSSGKLKRHIKRNHKNEPEVAAAVLQSTNRQNSFFDLKRKEGIYEYNLRLMTNDKEPSMRERQPKYRDRLRVCSACKTYVSNRYFFKHKCIDDKPDAFKPILLQKTAITKMDKDDDFRDILNRFRDGEVGDTCRTNDTVKLIGYRHFNMRRHENSKQNEVRKVVMAEMRELSRLYLTFQEISGSPKSVESMLTRENLPDLREAIERMVALDKPEAGRKEKHGQKLFLDAVILRSVKTLRGHYAEIMQDDKGKEMKLFKEAYKHKSNEIYSSARQTCVKSSMEKLRRPAHLPNEMELNKLKCYLDYEIKETVEKFSIGKYASLRTLLVSKLTLFNARRGDEASRMLINEWEDAKNNIWLPSDQVEKIEDPAKICSSFSSK